MARLLIVHHSPSPTLGALTDAVAAGARDEQIQGVETTLRPALEATAEDVLAADGIILGTSANFGYMSGALKHFFDSTFLHIGGSLDDGGGAGGSTTGTTIPYAVYVHGRYDLTGAIRSVDSIVQALPWRRAADTLEVIGDLTAEDAEAAYDLGATMAALLMP